MKTEHQVRQIMGQSLKGLDHDMVASKMKDILGRDITKGMLYGFVRSATKGRVVRFPFAWAPAFCAATSNHELLRWFIREALHGFPNFKQSVLDSRRALQRTLAEIEKITGSDEPKESTINQQKR